MKLAFITLAKLFCFVFLLTTSGGLPFALADAQEGESHSGAATAAKSQASASKASSALQVKPEKSSDSGFSSEDFMAPDGFISKRSSPSSDQKALLRVIVRVPHNTDLINRFIAYPYPMRPPHAKKPLTAMPVNNKELKALLLNTGYANRNTTEKPYPQGGWRWQYVYKNALSKISTGEPHMISEMYQWQAAMLPLVRQGARDRNDLEEERQKRLERCNQEFDQTRADAEAAALRKGYYPVELKTCYFYRDHLNEAQVRLGEGTWWIVGTHRVPGLIYYWQEPVELVNGSLSTVELTEDNALLIEGGW